VQKDDPFIGTTNDWALFQPPSEWSAAMDGPPPAPRWTGAFAPATVVPPGVVRGIMMPLSKRVSTVLPADGATAGSPYDRNAGGGDAPLDSLAALHSRLFTVARRY
jgi:hypothetical protein